MLLAIAPAAREPLIKVLRVSDVQGADCGPSDVRFISNPFVFDT
jgi:hypothetical protein